MDEFERELLIMDMEDQYQKLLDDLQRDLIGLPDWYLVFIGRQESTIKQYYEARKLFWQLTRFPRLPNESIPDHINRFEKTL
jgi:hypothetical protein